MSQSAWVNSMVMLSKKIIFWLKNRFKISICPSVMTLMTKFNEEKEYEEIRTIKIFKFENTRSEIKKCCSHWEKRKISQTYHIYQRGPTIYLQKLILCYWLYRWTSHSMWCSSCRKYFCRWLPINDKNEK